MTRLSTDEMLRKQTVLKGPPGLLFGLTLLVLVAAMICPGWGPDPMGDETTGLPGNTTETAPTAADAVSLTALRDDGERNAPPRIETPDRRP